jgi:hypothetical protein
MQLNLPKMITFWIAVAVAAVGVILYVVHYFAGVALTGGIGFILVAAAFVLLCLGLTIKGL